MTQPIPAVELSDPPDVANTGTTAWDRIQASRARDRSARDTRETSSPAAETAVVTGAAAGTAESGQTSGDQAGPDTAWGRIQASRARDRAARASNETVPQPDGTTAASEAAGAGAEGSSTGSAVAAAESGSAQASTPAAAEPAGTGTGTGRRSRPADEASPAAGVLLTAAVALVAVLLAVLTGGSPAVVPSHHPAISKPVTPVTSGTQQLSAATWISGQVSHSDRIACDPAMCQAIVAAGVPSGRVDPVAAGLTSAPGMAIIVATPTIRDQLRGLAVYAPVLLASFGTGGSRIDVRASVPHANSYKSTFAASLTERKRAGSGLLASGQVTATPSARAALTAGEVDPRMLSVILFLATRQRLHIVAFGDASPGVSPAAVPFRSVELTRASGRLTANFERAAQSFLKAQAPAFRPSGTSLVPVGSGHAVKIVFAAPSPTGLLTAIASGTHF